MIAISARARSLARLALSTALVGASLATGTVSAQATRPVAPITKTTPAAKAPTAKAPTKAPAAGPAVRTANNNVPAKAPAGEPIRILAVVNTEQIGRQELATECLRRYGEDVLETLVNRRVIEQACKDAGITITEQDVDAEIKAMADKFKMSPDRWLAMLQEERGIKPEQYRHEILWPTLALRSLAKDQLTISQEELQQEWEATYGPKVKVRVISVDSESQAKEILSKVKAAPSQFGEYAKNFSKDANSASAHGLIPPVGMHIDEKEIETAVFALKEGQISGIVKSGARFHIFKCEKHIPEVYVDAKHAKDAEGRLIDKLEDDKLRKASTDLFASLQGDSKLINVYNDEKLRAQYPGVAAFVNKQPLTIATLAEECIARHGADVLEGEINRKILTQELRRKKLEVTQADLDDEIARAAIAYGYVKGDGTADLAKWQKSIEQNDGATVDLYIRDAVWPSVALKKLVAKSVNVTEDDMKKGFEANYGERVEVLAIVMNDHREAQKVWEMARETPTDVYFGKLATQYSIDPVSRGNDGRVPPIRRHSGQPVLEKAAFALKAGEPSGLISIDNNYIILKCLGRTRPVTSEFEAVKDELYSDLHEKKLRVAMATEFERLREAAEVDNRLTGVSHEGKRILGPVQNDAAVKPAGGTRPIATPRVGTLPASK